jgi:hypothetical protein
MSVTPGMHLTRGGRMQRPLTCRPSGWLAGQTPWPVDPTLQPPVSFLARDTLQEALEWNLRPGVCGGRDPWLVGHVAGPAGQHQANYWLNQVSNFSGDSYKYSPY